MVRVDESAGGQMISKMARQCGRHAGWLSLSLIRRFGFSRFLLQRISQGKGHPSSLRIGVAITGVRGSRRFCRRAGGAAVVRRRRLQSRGVEDVLRAAGLH